MLKGKAGPHYLKGFKGKARGQSDEELSDGSHGDQISDHGDQGDNQSCQELIESAAMATIKPANREPAPPPARKRSPSQTETRQCIEPARVAFRFYTSPSPTCSPSAKEAYAVFEPTSQTLDVEEAADQKGLTMSGLLSSLGGTYNHSAPPSTTEPTEWASDRMSQKSGPYDISYRNNDVNSYRLGKNSFAIRPTKSAHRANRSKQVLPRTQSEIVSYTDTAHTKESVTTAAMASPVLGSPTLLNTSVHNHSKTHIISKPVNGTQRASIGDSKQLQQTLKAVQSWHSSTPKPEIVHSTVACTVVTSSGLPRPESKELVQVTSYKPRSEPQKKGNFTGGLVDKMLQVKRHSVPRDLTGQQVPALVQQQRRSLGSMQNKEGNNRMVINKPEKKMKQNSISWDAVSPEQYRNSETYRNQPISQTSYVKLNPGQRVSPWAQVKTSLRTRPHNKVGRMGFSPHALL